jgi:hypothetical protein
MPVFACDVSSSVRSGDAGRVVSGVRSGYSTQQYSVAICQCDDVSVQLGDVRCERERERVWVHTRA